MVRKPSGASAWLTLGIAGVLAAGAPLAGTDAMAEPLVTQGIGTTSCARLAMNSSASQVIDIVPR